ncbi:MAG TPA: DUF72 domain-containing protein [Candidatus Sulfotelmatobacter sp.]|jgi:uncharacterized protein YecE (DUF72 family)
MLRATVTFAETSITRMSCEIRIGTSGFHYKHWKGPFYPQTLRESAMLEFYTRHFDTVELNNSFYRLPTAAAFEAWREATPENFLFAVKASRFITHNKKLKDPENALDNLLPRAAHLGHKLGPILFQLPPKWRINPERLQNLLAILPTDLRYAFEFREASWITEEIFSTLGKFNAALCIYQLAGYQSPLAITADFTYVRLHGPESGKYQGSYSEQQLSQWARQIEAWAKELRAVYFYFDNDQAGFAAANAMRLREMVLGRGMSGQAIGRAG